MTTSQTCDILGGSLFTPSQRYAVLDLPPPIDTNEITAPAFERQPAASPGELDMMSLLKAATQASQPRILSVGASEKYQTLKQAIKASRSGDRIELAEGIYPDTFVETRHPLTIVGLGQGATLQSDRLIPNGKAYIVSNADLTVENVAFKNAKVHDENGAGIRHQKGHLMVVRCTFEKNQNGILAATNRQGTINIEESDFFGNGFGKGYTHGIYVGEISALSIKRSHFAETKAGHHIKSRAAKSTIENNFLDDGSADASYSIDLPNGGENIVRGNVMIQSSNPGNPAFISFGSRLTHTQNSLAIENNLFVNHFSKGTGVNNYLNDPVFVRENVFIKVPKIAKGEAVLENNSDDQPLPTTQSLYDTWNQTAQ
jgi:hypothetical protein